MADPAVPDQDRLRKVWSKGAPIPQYDENVWRRDPKGRAMQFSAYGNRDSKFGWEVDHIRPLSKGGTDALANLQPLHWESNAEKGDSYP